MKLNHILKDSDYKLTQFKQPLIDDLEQQIIEKESKGKISYKVNCLIRSKEIHLTPEEVIRQLYLRILMQEYDYPAGRIQLEYSVSFGVEKKRADIAIMDKDRPETPYIIVELKKPKLKEGKEQLKSYCNATGAPMGVWTNGEQISYYHRKDPNYFEDLPRIPHAHQKLSEVLTERWTIADLIENDKLLKERKSLKELILEMEDEVLANAGVDVFEELFKLIFTKLYDEMESSRNEKRHLEFRNDGDTEFELKTKIQRLFEKAGKRWEGVFSENSKIELTPSHLSICVASLQDVKLFNSNLEVVDEAFEYLINKTSKGEKGQYFTPRYVIDMCVKMLNPKESETMIDTAAGSCGFPVHTIFHVWKQILAEEGIAQSHLLTSEKKSPRCEDYVHDKVFAIDFDEKAVRVGRTLNLIAGDGQTNVLHLNTLDYDRWYERVDEDEGWRDIYGEGWKRLKRLRVEQDNRCFQFDVLMANPPFAGDIKETRILAKYHLGKKPDGKRQTAVGRDILFIERNLDFLKPGGRMAVVLPQGRFNNSSDKVIREFIAERCRILAVVGLHGNVFKPHTGTKTSVLFLQKWTDDRGICPKREDYPIFFATMQKPSKDNSGEKIFVKQADGEFFLDEHGHRVVEHDLFNTSPNPSFIKEGNGVVGQDGIAEAFVEFAKKEKLSFFDLSPFDEVKYRALLEGLEVSVLMLSEVLKDDDNLRIESEFFKKKYLRLNKELFLVKTDKLENLSSKITDGTHYTPDYTEQGVPFLSAINVKENYLDIEADYKFISQKEHATLFKRCNPEKNDILLRKVGVGARWACVVPENCFEFSVFVSVALIKLKNSVNPFYISTFINTELGQTQLIRFNKGISQPDLHLEEIRKLRVPIFSKDFQLEIEHLVKLAHSKLEESKTTYAAAENLLLETLGLKDFQPSQQNVNIKSFKESFLTSGRLDAEFYQLKYQNILAILRQSNLSLQDVVKLRKTIFSPKKTGFFNYIEIGDLTGDGITQSQQIDIKEKPSRAQWVVRKNDIITSTVRPIRKLTALITNKQDGFVCSSGFAVLQPENYLPEVLLVYLRLPIICELLDLYTTASMYPAISIQDLLDFPIPFLDKELQTQIADKIQTSFALRQHSEQLLELAKQAVEIAIEKGENEAINFIKNAESR